MMQALCEAILEDEAILEGALKYEVLTRQGEASDDQEVAESILPSDALREPPPPEG
jgi:hypothetical protein